MRRGDAVELTRHLVRIDSRNPSLVPGAPGESGVASALAQVLREWGLHVEMMDTGGGRCNVIARTRAPGQTGGRRSLMFNGHMDVVGTEGMVHAPFDAFEKSGRIYGRGSTDMKSGVAAMCAAALRAKEQNPDCDIVICAVTDEEYRSAGTSTLLKHGVRADAAIVTEPTCMAVAPSHKGFAWIDVTVAGRAAHGSRYDVGIDAIMNAGVLLAELDRFGSDVLSTRTHPLLGHASLHASFVEGGIGMSTYPDRCVLKLERRTVPGEDAEQSLREVASVCSGLRQHRPQFDARCTLEFAQSPSDVSGDAPIVRALEKALAGEDEEINTMGLSAWTDAALLNAAGIPAICYGPGDIALAHAAEEYVDIGEIERATNVLTRLALDWTSGRTA
jgi:acetylornithine deacetylase